MAGAGAADQQHKENGDQTFLPAEPALPHNLYMYIHQMIILDPTKLNRKYVSNEICACAKSLGHITCRWVTVC